MIELALPRRGHFDLGTGYHGDVWLDLDALFLRPALLRPHVRVLADRLREHEVDAAAALPVPFYAVDEIQSHAWLPDDCPLCADGIPTTDR